MRVLIFGGSGGIGSQLTQHMIDGEDTHHVIPLSSKDCDVTSEWDVKRTINMSNPDAIIYLSVKNIDGLLHKQTKEDLESCLDVNVVGFFNVLKYATELFRTNGFGRMIYVSSILADRPIKGTGVYSACKSFCETLVKTHSLENSKYGITSNSIRLGYFEGGLTEKVPENVLNNVKEKIPMNRLGQVSELYNLINVIIKTPYINGTTISITGGLENV